MKLEEDEQIFYDTRFNPPKKCVYRNGFWVSIEEEKPKEEKRIILNPPKKRGIIEVFYKRVRDEESIPDVNFSVFLKGEEKSVPFKVVRRGNSVFLVSYSSYLKEKHPDDEVVINACKDKVQEEIEMLEKEIRQTDFLSKQKYKGDNIYNLHYIHQTQFSQGVMQTDRQWKRGLQRGGQG